MIIRGADDVAEATRLVEAAEKAGVPLLVGHHRRHNPMIREAKKAIERSVNYTKRWFKA